jgi:hypothetical protein
LNACNAVSDRDADSFRYSEETRMPFIPGDRVLVNVAPFIGLSRPARDSVPCEILDVVDDQVLVRPEPPCRSISLWIDRQWIDCRIDSPHAMLLEV